MPTRPSLYTAFSQLPNIIITGLSLFSHGNFTFAENNKYSTSCKRAIPLGTRLKWKGNYQPVKSLQMGTQIILSKLIIDVALRRDFPQELGQGLTATGLRDSPRHH